MASEFTPFVTLFLILFLSLCFAMRDRTAAFGVGLSILSSTYQYIHTYNIRFNDTRLAMQ